MKSLHILFGLLAVACAADEAQPALATNAERTYLIDHDTRLEELGLNVTDWMMVHYRNRVAEWRKDLPAGWQIRLVTRDTYSNHPGRNGIYAEPYRIVKLNPDGQPHGVEKIFAVSGAGPGGRIEWRNGVKHGLEIVEATHRVEIPWVDGRVNGVRRTYHPGAPTDEDGERKVHTETRYVDGAASGPTRTLDHDGRLVREGTMVGGKRHGAMTDYWSATGNPKRVVTYEHGKAMGEAREYYASGQLKRVVPFRNGVIHGEERQYEIDGTVSRTRPWIDGRVVSPEEYEAQRDAAP